MKINQCQGSTMSMSKKHKSLANTSNEMQRRQASKDAEPIPTHVYLLQNNHNGSRKGSNESHHFRDVSASNLSQSLSQAKKFHN